MKINKRTPRSEIFRESLLGKMSTFYKQMAVEIGGELYKVDQVLSELATLSSRVVFDAGEIDFDLCQPGDTAEDVRAKCNRYLDTQKVEVVETALRRIWEMDQPSEQATGPESLPEGAAKN